MIKNKLKVVAATLALGATLAGCAGTPSGITLGQNARFSARSASTWAMQTFFALDNDLDHGTGIVSELHAAAARTQNVGAATLYDGAKQNDTLYVYNAPGKSHQTLKKGEVDSGTGAALDEFLSFASQNVSASRRALSMADHGGGIVRGICSDWNGPGGHKIIHLNEVAVALEKNPVEVMMFDACFMQMMEVAYELRHGAKVLIGAQTTTRGDFPYENIVGILDQNAAADSATLAKKLLAAIADNARYEVAFGAVDITKSEEVAKKMRVLSELVLAKAKDRTMKKTLQDAIRNSMGYANERDAGMTMYNNYRDMLDVMKNLAKVSDPEISRAAEEVATATQATIIAESHRGGGWFGGGLDLDKASGIALYAQVDGPVEAKYLTRAWNKDTRWGDALALINSTGWAPAVQVDKYPFAFPAKK